MLKVLLKKQLFELNRNFFFDPKKGTLRSKASSTAFIVFYILLMVGVLGGMFSFLAASLCPQFVSLGYDWLYFSMMKLIAVMLGIFGSVFNTYASLYKAKDNDMLLSMPIPAKYILAVRLVGVYVMSLMYSAIVMIPAVIVYFIYADLTVSAVIGGVVSVINVSVFVLAMSCVFGWLVAKISDKLKKKSLVTVAVSLVFFAAYYYVYMNAYNILQSIIKNVDVIGEKIKGAAYPLYIAGKAAAGDLLALLIIVAAVLLLFAVIYYIIAHSFINIATSSGNEDKIKYREKKVKRKSAFSALLSKESSHFFSSPTYMLNCGLGTLFLLAAGIIVLIKTNWVRETLLGMLEWDKSFVAVIAMLAICMISTMNDISAPSVSLEGKSLWILQSLPVTAKQALKAKIFFHLLMTLPPVLFCSICACIAIKADAVSAALTIILPLVFAVFLGLFGLAINIKKPNLTWTSEAVAVKQSISIMSVIFGGWVIAAVIGAPYLLLYGHMNPDIYFASVSVIIAAISALLFRWINTKGAKIFETL